MQPIKLSMINIPTKAGHGPIDEFVILINKY